MKVISTFLALLGLVAVTLAFADNEVAPPSSTDVAEPMPAGPCIGDFWCCGHWTQCRCYEGFPQVVKYCRENTHCVHEGGGTFKCAKNGDTTEIADEAAVTALAEVAPVDEPVHANSCNGDYWCCSTWFGCQCVNGSPKVVATCQKGTHCVHDGGSNFYCDKGRVANDDVTPAVAIGASPSTSTEVAIVEDPVHAASCNGDYWCCDKWHGCQCVNGAPKAVANCQKGTHCVYQGNGSFRCDKGNREIRAEEGLRR